MICHNMVA